MPVPKYIEEICKIGQGADCCRYLTVGPDGFCCEKLTPLKHVLDGKADNNEMTALGINCEGHTKIPGT